MSGTTVVSQDRSGTDGIDFGADNETWIVNAGVYVWGTTIGASSIYNHNTLKNSGHIIGNSLGVDLSGDSLVINNVTGVIEGHDYGVFLDVAATQAKLINHGSIASADYGVYFSTTTHAVSLNNTGSLIGGIIGVWQASIYSGGTIVNSGLIRSGLSGGNGIYVHTDSAVTTAITNAATGIIKGTPLAIYTDKGHFSLNNLGRIVGQVVDTVDLADTVVNHGKIAGRVYLGGGADIFDGTGGTAGLVFGAEGNDRLIGGSHADSLHGGDDLDRLTGKGGADRFVFDSAVSASSLDRITDFSRAQGDKIVLSATEFVGIGAPGPLAPGHFRAHPNAVNPNQHILYNPANGFLYYDQDGSGGTYAPIHFATLTTHPVLASTDFVVIA